jgi:8-oxo-dGTP diphosphatase
MWLPVPVRRLGYRLAYAGLRVYWYVMRPEVSGVKCVLTRGPEVLLVRHTYGQRGWDLPGGTVRRGEAPATTAWREMHEELGVSIDDWRPMGMISVSFDHRRDRLHCFQAELPAAEIEIDRGELSDAEWFSRNRLPGNLGKYAGEVLALVPEPGS